MPDAGRSTSGGRMTSPTHAGLPVLLLEDNLHLRQVLVDALTSRGHTITVCEDVDTAWEAYAIEHHAIVVLALQPKQGDGLQLGRRIRESATGDASVLILVAGHRPAKRLLPLLSVADDCWVKPLKPDLVEMRLAVAERVACERLETIATQAETQGLREEIERMRSSAANGPAPANVVGGAETTDRAEPGFRGRMRRIVASLGLAAGQRDTDGAVPADSSQVTGPVSNGTADAPGPAPAAVATGSIPLVDFKAFRGGSEGAAAGPETTEGWWDWDLSENTCTFSPQWKAMLGYAPDDIGDTAEEWLDRVHAEDREQLQAALDAHLEGRTPHLENQHRVRRADGTFSCVLARALAFRDGSGKAVRMTGSHADVTSQHGYDPLTGLPNRTNLIDRLGKALDRARAGDGRLSAVLFMDLDRFKNINYSLGHQIGDQLLNAVSGRLRSCLRGQDSPDRLGTTVAHVGGDEFAVLLEGIGEVNDAVRVAKRIQDELQAPFDVDGHEIFTSTSIGIAVSSPDYDRPEDLLRDADTAMFRAKALGKASYVVFDTAMHARAVSLLKLETELRRAVQREEFRVHYQPIVELENGKIVGFEALVRWQHPDGELLLPKDFLAVAEETGLIIAIDRQVARDVCKQLRSWNAQFRRSVPLTVSVNVSGVQFLRPDMIVEIDRTLRNYGVYGRSLKLEITESVIMEHARYAADMLQQLKALDIKLSIDDFGTGYSSLSYLRRFEIDTLKVDMSFVSRIDTDEDSWEIIRTIVTLGNNLGKDVVAEGIERGKQRELLLALRCKYGQGYFFSKPVDAEAATVLLAADSRGETLLKG
jgi:diguanylate cyclase (GGDEF)-like protein/PAS domain S-box-containing protein